MIAEALVHEIKKYKKIKREGVNKIRNLFQNKIRNKPKIENVQMYVTYSCKCDGI